jgi:hypothetical protein
MSASCAARRKSRQVFDIFGFLFFASAKLGPVHTTSPAERGAAVSILVPCLHDLGQFWGNGTR